MNDTIVAVVTSGELSTISIVRLSGNLSYQLAQKITHKKFFEPKVIKLTDFFNKNSEVIDNGIILYFKSPKSFTGEDVIEFQCHGGLIIVEELIESLLFYGARLAKAGEFTKRAFLNGKIDLTKAEAISKLIESKSKFANKILMKHLKGDLKVFINKHRDNLINILAYSEVLIDYTEEDFPSNILDNIYSQLENLIKEIDKILSSSNRRKGLINGFKVTIIGKPNVGKSSFLNNLLNYERSIVSDVAGTTRDTIEENIRIGSHIIKFIDTAGIRNTNNSIEKMGVQRSLESINESNVIIAIFDKNSFFDKEDEKILEIINNLPEDKHLITLLNKSDLNLKFDLEKIKHLEFIEINVKNSIDNLLINLEKFFNKIGEETEDIILISERQIDSVIKVKISINESKKYLKSEELELFSYNIKDAIDELSLISKPYQNEELLDKIFSQFCLGK